MQRHKMDPLSLAFGLGFAALGLVFLTADLDFSILRPSALVPAGLLFLGLLVLLMALNRTRERDDLGLNPEAAPETEAAEAAEAEDEDAPSAEDGEALAGERETEGGGTEDSATRFDIGPPRRTPSG